jgi:predicted dithiol-disulfide oxidoreductase (DUF899 family)
MRKNDFEINTRANEEANAMTDHEVGTCEEWLRARKELLAREKELTRSDELARQRRELPWVRVEKEYTFETDEGKKTQAELFEGRSQLLVYHFMFGPSERACVRPAAERFRCVSQSESTTGSASSGLGSVAACRK